MNVVAMKSVNSDIAYDYIKKRILSGEFVSGQSLATNTLSEEIGVSRTPVRDALWQLESDGLVTIQTRLGASVKRMELKEFREMCGLRLALESYAAGLAAQQRTDADLREMGAALEAMGELTERIAAAAKEEPLLGDLRTEDVRFHIAIIGAARNDLLKKEILRLHLINRVVSASVSHQAPLPGSRAELNRRRKTVMQEHESIFKAIERRDTATARDAMAAHIQDIVDHTLRQMAAAGAGGVGKDLTEEELSYLP